MSFLPRWILVALTLVSIGLVVSGVLLIATDAFPHVTCYGDACLIGENEFALPATVSGIALGLVVIAAKLLGATVDSKAAKH